MAGLLVVAASLGQGERARDAVLVVAPFPQQEATKHGTEDGLPSDDVLRLLRDGEGRLWAETGGGWASWSDGRFHRAGAPARPIRGQGRAGIEPRAVSVSLDQRVAVAEVGGLFYRAAGAAEWRRLLPADERRSWAPIDVRDVAFDAVGRLWFVCRQGLGGGDPRSGEWRLFAVEDGLPVGDLTAVAPSPDGAVWLGTTAGALRYDGERWEVRQGPRWLPGDVVRDILVDGDGAAWIATDGGVGRIATRPMTLRRKAALFEAEIDRHHRRTPYGYVGSVRLARPGDRSELTQRDSDNDGLWTAMYGAGEAFAYAATGDPRAKRRARQAFEALRFLSEVTQGGTPEAPPGLVARTILPTSGPDPNAGRLEQDRRRKAEGDRLWKILDPRWGTSADGRWYWKSDASSDELDGHYFFYAVYYDLAAEGEEEREEVREVVRRITDHLLEHGLTLVDHDGRPTRWAVFSPEKLNHDPDWWEERGLNSLSVLSYLRVAGHTTGEARYGEAARRLIDEHAYLANLRVPKIHEGPGTGNQSDDEMAFMSFYNLLAYERDAAVREIALHAFYRYWRLVAPERNPLFNFLYAAFGRGAVYEDAFGRGPLDPGDFDPAWLEDSIDTLKRYPLDRVDWPLRNSHRRDVVFLRGSSERGHLRDGKVLPIDERFVDKWNHDPWRLDQGGDGRTLADGASYLLPYYLGLYHGFFREGAAGEPAAAAAGTRPPVR